jgi:hypothetical protein
MAEKKVTPKKPAAKSSTSGKAAATRVTKRMRKVALKSARRSARA